MVGGVSLLIIKEFKLRAESYLEVLHPKRKQ